MNFFKLRILNTSLIFIIGILLGFIIKDKIFTVHITQAPSSSVVKTESRPIVDISSKTEEYNVFDDDDDYDIPVPRKIAKKKNNLKEEKKTLPKNEDEAVKFVDFSAPFFNKPSKFKNEIVTMDIQMIFARKVDSGWLLNLMHVDSQKGVKYVYLDSDILLTDKVELKIGYFYRVSFKCVKGLLNKGNMLLSIAPTGKKADWATGVSAIE